MLIPALQAPFVNPFRMLGLLCHAGEEKALILWQVSLFVYYWTSHLLLLIVFLSTTLFQG